MSQQTTISFEAALLLCKSAALKYGASEQIASSLAAATVAAHARGQESVGFGHFFDYLDSISEGRINPVAFPIISRPAPAVISSDAQCGIAQLGFDVVFEELVATTENFGLAMFTQRNSYTCGALGYFAERLAERGLIALAAGNAPALMAAGGAKKPIYGTNPIAFAAPQSNGSPLLIDQASSATAYVNIRAAAEAGRRLPEGWALDGAGDSTTDPVQALKGALLAFGGVRGGNIALMVEMLSVISGANWSLDAPSFLTGEKSPCVGMVVIAIAPQLIDPTFPARVSDQLSRLHEEYGVIIPGIKKAEALKQSYENGLTIAPELYAKLCAIIESPPLR